MSDGVPPVRVLLLEDDDDQREALAVTLRGLELAVDGAASVAEFDRLLRSPTDYAVAVVDLGLPDGDGREVVRFLAEQTSMGIIILSAAGDVRERIGGFDIGADLYFVKPVDGRELAAAVRRLASRRSTEASPAIPPGAEQPPWRLTRSLWRLASPGGGDVLLTPKEMQAIEVLAKQPGAVVSRGELLQYLDYPDDAVGHRRLEALIRRLRLKLADVSEDGPPIATSYGVGYAFSRPLTFVQTPAGRKQTDRPGVTLADRPDEGRSGSERTPR